MMKDLKHYFSSPKDNELKNGGIVKETNQIVINNILEKLNSEIKKSASKEKSKKKKRKRKLSDSDVSISDVSVIDDIVEPSDKKKRKKSLDTSNSKNKVNISSVDINQQLPVECSQGDTPKTAKRSKRKDEPLKTKKTKDSGSSKENSIGSDTEDKSCATPENSKNLLNYFNKVDKIPEIIEKPRKIKVEVLVHADLSGSPPEISKKSSVKKRKSKRKSVVDFDLITSDELPEDKSVIDDSKTESHKAKEGIKIKQESEVKTENTTPLKNGKNRDDVILTIEESENFVNKTKRRNGSETINGNKSTKINKKYPDKSVDSNDDEVIIVESNITQDKPKIKPDAPDIINGNKSAKNNKKYLDKSVDNDDDDNEIIIVESNITQDKPKIKHDGTLASFFNLANRPAPLPLEKRSSAKLQFLLSGTPSSVKRVTTTTVSCMGSIAPFPRNSHLQQKEKMNILWNLSPVKFDLKPLTTDHIKPPAWSSIIDRSEIEKPPVDKDISSFDLKNILKGLKKELNLFPISCWIKELKKMKKGNDGFMWTERYRPHSSSAFLANTRSISKLKAWLTDLKETSIAESGASSGDEFVKDTDGEQKFDRKTVILLSGLPGTGKTASVYAIAEEIGYNVLEINASCNRSGKRILNEFSEAMQSHKVGVAKLQFSKVKKKTTEELMRNLILIEDADLLFDDDEGFVPTLMNLGASAKRPIILVANNPQAKHFGKMSHLFHSTLPFVPPTQDRLGSWLRTVSIVEGFKLGREDSIMLASSQDLRKCLLQLQLTQTNAKSIIKEGEREFQVWNSTSDIDFTSKKGRKKVKRIMTTLADLDRIRQEKKHREVPPYWHRPLEDSTLNLECQSTPSQNLHDIEASLLGLISPASTHRATTSDSKSLSYEIPRNLLEIEKDACSMTSLLNRRSLALDYWPVLRQISRSEATRLASHTKRNNRYFNYLSSLGVKGPSDLFQSLSSALS